jgi:hypothetical protein
MSIFRSYFNKSNNIISGIRSNSAKNPVMEISAYGVDVKKPSRYIFDVNLEGLIDKVNKGIITQNNCRHYLNMTNTIRYSSENIGNKSYSNNIVRASSFNLELFNINEDWDEGSGYSFNYNPITITEQASNWYERKNGYNWANEGVNSGEIIGNQRFDNGNENLIIDITDYINQRIFTGYTGTTVYSGDTYGIGIKFTDDFENLEFTERQSVGFHSKDTNTFYVPYIETRYDDLITDDRNYFYLDNNNSLYLYLTNVSENDNITINNVEIYDYNDIIYSTISNITKIRYDLYKITLNISSTQYPDCIIFKDKWNFSINGRDIIYSGEFYIQPNDNNNVLTQNNQFNVKNYCLSLFGINDNDRFVAGDIRKIRIAIRSIYESMQYNKPLNIKYRVYTKINNKFEVNIINPTQFNRTAFGYNFELDTTWLIPQDYFLEVTILDANNQMIKNVVSFTIIEDILK